MSEKEINKKNFDSWKEELEKLIKEMTEDAKAMVEDYVKNPSELSGSVTQIHEDSPLLKENKKDVN